MAALISRYRLGFQLLCDQLCIYQQLDNRFECFISSNQILEIEDLFYKVQFTTPNSSSELHSTHRLHKSIPWEGPFRQALETLQGVRLLLSSPLDIVSVLAPRVREDKSSHSHASVLRPQTSSVSPHPDWMITDQRQWGVLHTPLHVSPRCDFAGFSFNSKSAVSHPFSIC